MRNDTTVFLIIGVVLAVLSIIAIYSNDCQAGEVEAIALSSTKFTERYDHGVGTWVGIQVNYMFDDEFYIFGSQENLDVLLLGGKAWGYDIKGVGLGTKYKVNKRFNLFGQVGYYMVENSWGNYQRRENNEAIHYYLNERYAPGETQSFHAYSVGTSGYTLGATLGAEYAYPLTENWSTGFVMSYRHLKIKEDISGYNDSWGCPPETTVCDKWHSVQNEDYSSINVGFHVTGKF